MSSLTWTSIRSLTCWRNRLGNVHDLIEYIFHHHVILYVNKIVRAHDRFAAIACQILSAVVTRFVCPQHEQRCAGVHSFGRNLVGLIVRDVEGLGGLENQDKEGECLLICEIAPE